MSPVIMCKLTPDLDASKVIENTERDFNDGPKPGACRLLMYKRVLFASLTQFFNLICFTFGNPTLAPRLIETFEFEQYQVGLVFALPTTVYIIMGIVILPRLTKRFEKRTSIHIGLLILTAALLLSGPSGTLGFP